MRVGNWKSHDRVSMFETAAIPFIFKEKGLYCTRTELIYYGCIEVYSGMGRTMNL